MIANMISREEFDRVIKGNHNLPNKYGAERKEANLQGICEQWLEKQGYRRLTPANALLPGFPAGWYGHLVEPKKNPFMPDLFLFRDGRYLMVELKVEDDNGKIHYGIGQKAMISRIFWKLATSLDEFQNLVYDWEKTKTH